MLHGCLQWGPAVLRRRWKVRGAPPPTHVLFCIADHHEPFRREIGVDGVVRGGCSVEEALARMKQWQQAFRATVTDIRDTDGFVPRHTFFYPWDEYDPDVLARLSGFCRAGYGEVEVHLHHRNDTQKGVSEKLVACRDTYAAEHGLLGRVDDQARFAFVHGNWALCNSRPDGDWCGVNREISILRKAGCYLDLTYPSAPSPTQPHIANDIYYGGDPPPRRSGHRYLGPARVGGEPPPDSLLMASGPLALDLCYRRGRRIPRLENGELTERNPPVLERFAAWQRIRVHVTGRPEWLVVKLHTHGLDGRSAGGVTGATARAFYLNLQAHCEAEGMGLHFVTARELYNIIKAAEAGKGGNPGAWREYAVAAPPACRA